MNVKLDENETKSFRSFIINYKTPALGLLVLSDVKLKFKHEISSAAVTHKNPAIFNEEKKALALDKLIKLSLSYRLIVLLLTTT